MKKKKNVSILLVTLDPSIESATSKQTGYIIGLLTKSNKHINYSDKDNHLLSKKQASKFIQALLDNKPIKIINGNEKKKLSQEKKKLIEKNTKIRLTNAKKKRDYRQKLLDEERSKMNAIKNLPFTKEENLHLNHKKL